ncbi:MAG: branched-chain alpha-keto acid dehydrogenase subunit E2 [Rhodobacteraceae bacterium PARR1]|nr:MAG: branched-chain alpha-keto acid dehydrogenase subunit E2 [Rhodobacteraceae bacterium PARR1]
MWRAVASNALTLFIVVLVVASGLLAWGRQQFTGVGPLETAICFRVERGASLSAVSRSLADYSGKADGLKFGSYLVPASASMGQVLDILTAGGQSTCGREVNFRISVAEAEVVLRELDPVTNRYVEVVQFDPAKVAAPAEYLSAAEADDIRWRITLAEGVTSWQVVDALRRADFLEGLIEKVPAEGTLAPDSYEVERGSLRADLITEMEARQAATLAELWAARAEGLPYDSPEQALIMASIVEKETGIPEERKQVASVFVNRLEQGMRLQTDPTVIYGITKGESVLGRGLRQSELRRRTDWNTYVIDGLPPTPIANPGRLSIEAALNPDTTDFLFFVADGSGGHVFATNLADHNRNVAEWRKIERAQGQAETGGVQGAD